MQKDRCLNRSYSRGQLAGIYTYCHSDIGNVYHKLLHDGLVSIFSFSLIKRSSMMPYTHMHIIQQFHGHILAVKSSNITLYEIHELMKILDEFLSRAYNGSWT